MSDPLTKARAKRSYERNREKVKARCKAYYHANRERYRELATKYQITHRLEIALRKKLQRQRDREKIAQQYRLYRQSANGKAMRINADHRRRALKLKTVASVTSSELQQIKQLAKGRCFYCKKKRVLTFDHVTSLSNGGTHSKDNIVCACQPCNSRKSAKRPDEFARQIGLLLI